MVHPRATLWATYGLLYGLYTLILTIGFDTRVPRQLPDHCGGFAMLSNSFSEESVKIIHLTYAKVMVGGSKNSPRKKQILLCKSHVIKL